MKTVLLAIAIAALWSMSMAATPTVKVEQGLLQGTVEDGLTVYRGLPFAAPPMPVMIMFSSTLERRW
jgi:para-nitrobenzyl esterase